MRRAADFTRASMRTIAFVALLLAGCCVGIGGAMAAAIPVPALDGHVVNQTQMLTDPQVQALEAKLAAFEGSKGRRIAILVVESTGEESREQYSYRVFDAWKLGEDDLLILVTDDPYDERITPGRALATVFTHPIMKRILDEDMSWPRVKIGDINGELNGGVDRIIKLENGEAMPPPPKPEGRFSPPSVWEMLSPPPLSEWLAMFVGLLFIYFVVSGLLSWKGALLRGSCTAVAIGGFLLLLGSGIGFALGFAALAFYLGVLNKSDGTEPTWDPDPATSSDSSFGSIAWSVLTGVASSAISSGSGFRGGGGGFSGGGASGSW